MTIFTHTKIDYAITFATIGVIILSLLFPASLSAEVIGSVSTKFKLLGANDKIVIEAFDDPDINGATCYLSRAKTGGVSGVVGIAEDTSDASIACRQVGPITLSEDIRSGKANGDEVFKKVLHCFSNHYKSFVFMIPRETC